MNFTNEKVNGTGSISVTDSLNGPLLKLQVTCNSNTTVPNTNEMKIIVDRRIEESEERREISYFLERPLALLNDVSDVFCLEPVIKDDQVTMKAYVKRYILENTVLTEPDIEEITYEKISLLEGANVIITNYLNASLEIVYPKNTDAMKYFLNSAIFDEHEKKSNEVTMEDLYFKDAFTKVNNEVDLAVNQLEIGCLSSKNNKFSLDEDGNLTVQSITSATGNSSVPFDAIYPVGSIYFSVNNVNPTTLFGGSWEQIKDCFLLACGDDFAAGSVGGEKEVGLTSSQLPAHTHGSKSLIGSFEGRRYGNGAPGTDIVGIGGVTGNQGIVSRATATWSGSHGLVGSFGGVSNPTIDRITINATHEHSAVGEGQTHNNMPPYLSVYVWKRFA